MGITEFFKAKNLGEYLESRKHGQVRERIQQRSCLEVLFHKARTTKINPENHQKMKKTKHGS
ncbi:Uncharacterised protein [Streptococcus cristatus]|uniref:Uncharacterized protein n=2 Tax=Streptococcus cristatus TaxID=45634 RepID=A0A512AAC6_STRCR|nr:hypothetical protein [Streptococcus cristatus]AGK70603.1 hypothetical protein I872_02475 [Streptococcus cristatus AS 1.3089]GEN96651.1 hypothetical protein SOL01_05250 [Streptococcus cristatus]SQI46434.1 Uncharacterised protein [Streptococcus cristatus]